MHDSDADDVFQRLADTAQRFAYSAEWQPTQCGDSQMRIAHDGRWFHQGSEIAKPALVQLFSRLLRRENEHYFLVTPVEKLSIAVDDAPFVSVSVEVQGEGEQQALYVTTNLGDTVLINAEHPLRVETDLHTQAPSPYVSIGNNLAVLLQRSDFYQLVEIAEQRELAGQRVMGVYSQGEFYSLGAF